MSSRKIPFFLETSSRNVGDFSLKRFDSHYKDMCSPQRRMEDFGAFQDDCFRSSLETSRGCFHG